MSGMPCPPWCVKHRKAAVGRAGETLQHLGEVLATADWNDLGLIRSDLLRNAQPGEVLINMGGETISADEAAALSVKLGQLAAQAGDSTPTGRAA